MTRISWTLDSELLRIADTRKKELGLTRSAYLRELILNDYQDSRGDLDE